MRSLFFGAVVTFGAALSFPSVAPATGADALSADARKVVEHLLADWSEHMHSTDVALAMQNLGMKPDDDLRLAVGDHLRANRHLARNLNFWRANNYLLSGEEKLLAKALVNPYDLEERIPDVAELSRETGLSADRVKDRLAFLARAGLLEASPGGRIGYTLTEKFATWGGPLRYNFHNITVGDAKPFGVW